ncbi:MAG: hypothetical protein ACJ79P_04890 [Myxococcales bacterium]
MNHGRTFLRRESKTVVRLLGAAVALVTLASSPAFAHGEKGPRYQLVDYFSVGGGAVQATALNHAGVFTAFTVTGIWGVDARTGAARQIDPCNDCFVTTINNAGDVAGFDFVGGFPINRIAFATVGGQRTSIPPFPGGRNSFAQGINNLGQVAGFANTATSFRAFLWEGGVKTDLGTLGGSFSFGLAINDRSQIAGGAAVDDTTEHAFLFDPEHGMRDIGTGTSWSSRALAVSSRGDAAGMVFTRPTPSEFVFHAAAFDEHGGGVRDLGTLPGLPGSEAFGINRDRLIVGFASTPDARTQHGFVFRDGKMFDLNDLIQQVGLVVTQALAINDDGIIVGFARDADGVQHAVALLPVEHDD